MPAERIPTTDTYDADYRHLRIRPSAMELPASTIGRTFERLHQLGAGDGTDGLLATLFNRRTTRSFPTIEVLLTSGCDAAVRYYVGIDDPSFLDGLEHNLRRLFPTGYSFERVADPLATVPEWPAADATVDADRVAAIEYRGAPERYGDWQLPLADVAALRSSFTPEAAYPLSTAVAAMTTSSVPVVYQALVRPKPDWTGAAGDRLLALQAGDATWIDRLRDELWGPVVDDQQPRHRSELAARRQPSTEARLEALEGVTASRTFDVNARVAAVTDADARGGADLEPVLRAFDGVFGGLGTDSYGVTTRRRTGTQARAVYEAIQTREFTPASHGRLRVAVPMLDATSPGIVADARSVPAFCVSVGSALVPGTA